MIAIIVIVSLLLSITSGLLKERQDKNIKYDTMKQILSSVPAIESEIQNGGDVAELYKTHIKQFLVLDKAGNVVKTLETEKDFGYRPEKDADENLLYVAEVEGETKYIIPLNGKGLWGAIGGYIALNDDKNTIDGIFFFHASETPGLGANIVAPAFRDQFKGKHIMNKGEFVSLLVAKTGEKSATQEQVDALSGGTITSKGVQTMLETSLGNFATFFNQSQDLSEKEEQPAAETEILPAEASDITAENVKPQTEGEIEL
jgi:Na+-transporting NADH:ubiquinone oxidoreductase subunit C